MNKIKLYGDFIGKYRFFFPEVSKIHASRLIQRIQGAIKDNSDTKIWAIVA